jgi:hypothetical protein
MLSTVLGGVANLAAVLLNRHLDVHSAREFSERIPVRNLISRTAIFVGEAQHGRAEEVLSLYDRTFLVGVKHNEHYDLVLLNLSVYSSEVSRFFTESDK